MIKDFIGLIYPNYCACCENILVKGEEMLCISCFYHLPRLDRYTMLSVARTFWGRVRLEECVAAFKFDKMGMIQQLIFELKYKSNPQIGTFLGKELGKKLAEEGCQAEMILPIPLHKNRLIKRGYNQSEKIANGVSEILEIPVISDLCFRKVDNQSQTNKSKIERWNNVTEVFGFRDAGEIRDKKILIVDDILTTGSTIESFCKTLAKAYYGSVSVGVVAYA